VSQTITRCLCLKTGVTQDVEQCVRHAERTVHLKVRLYENPPDGFERAQLTPCLGPHTLAERPTSQLPPPAAVRMEFAGVEVTDEETYGSHGVEQDAVLSLRFGQGVKMGLKLELPSNPDGKILAATVWPEETLRSMLFRVLQLPSPGAPKFSIFERDGDLLGQRWFAFEPEPVPETKPLELNLSDQVAVLCGDGAPYVLQPVCPSNVSEARVEYTGEITYRDSYKPLGTYRATFTFIVPSLPMRHHCSVIGKISHEAIRDGVRAPGKDYDNDEETFFWQAATGKWGREGNSWTGHAPPMDVVSRFALNRLPGAAEEMDINLTNKNGHPIKFRITQDWAKEVEAGTNYVVPRFQR